MLNNILFPTDFSSVANNALTFAIDLCKKTNATLHVLHVQNIPIVDVNYPMDNYQVFIEEAENLTDENFKTLESKTLQPSQIKYKTHKTIGSFVSNAIIDFTENNNVDLIIMGTTGSSGIESVLIGSNAASVVGKSEVPVFVIPPSANSTTFKHVLYSSDYNEPEFPTLSQLKYFADLYGADIAVLHVASENDHYFDVEGSFFVKHKKELGDVQLVTVENMEITNAINQQIEARQIDLVVLAKHNRGFFDRLFHRSFSKQMTYHTTTPLLVLNK